MRGWLYLKTVGQHEHWKCTTPSCGYLLYAFVGLRYSDPRFHVHPKVAHLRSEEAPPPPPSSAGAGG